jgi:MerR family mercuric resistance operon transcriptional regulator/MerR family gold-responsive transcriptional activator of gol and ges genes
MIGQLAAVTGVNIETIRYYERRNLLRPTSRLPYGYRLYDSDAQQRLRFIKNAQALGFTLCEVEELLDLRVGSQNRCSDVQRRAKAKLKQIEMKVQTLRSLEKALRRMIRACSQPANRCPILVSLENHEKLSRKRKERQQRR